MPTPKPTIKDLRAWIGCCDANLERLSEWERSFIYSVADQLERRGSLSEKQIEILERIYIKTP